MNVEFDDPVNDVWAGTITNVFANPLNFDLEKLSYNQVTEEYVFEVFGLYDTDWSHKVPKEEAEDEQGNIDPGKVLIWLLKKFKEAVCPSCQ